MRRLLPILALLALPLTARAQFLPDGMQPTPSGKRPAFSFTAPAAGAYSTLTASVGGSLSDTRASVATYLDGSGTRQTATSNTWRVESAGALGEPASTNFLINSTSPATQTTALLSTGSYTGWMEGSGSLAFSAGTAVATGLPCTATSGLAHDCHFTITAAGTIAATVSGTVTAEQLEKLGFRTSLIVTGGTSASRVVDAPGQGAVNIAPTQGVIRIVWTPEFSSSESAPHSILCLNDGPGWIYYNVAGSIKFNNSGNSIAKSGLSFSAQTSHTIIARWDATTIYLSFDGGPEASTSKGSPLTLTQVGVMRNGACGTGEPAAWVSRVTICNYTSQAASCL